MTNPNAARPNPLVTAIGEALRKKVTEMQEQAGQGALNSPQEVSGGLPKPDRQEIKDKSLSWVWKGPGDIRVEAVYVRETQGYVVSLDVSQNESACDLTSHESKMLGEILLSAYQWEQIWQSHVGEFLA
jgi:hypothetical protein